MGILTDLEYISRNQVTWEHVVKEIQAKILERTKLTCSIGIAPNKRLAKVCADLNKPNGYHRLEPDRYAIVVNAICLPVLAQR